MLFSHLQPKIFARFDIENRKPVVCVQQRTKNYICAYSSFIVGLNVELFRSCKTLVQSRRKKFRVNLVCLKPKKRWIVGHLMAYAGWLATVARGNVQLYTKLYWLSTARPDSESIALPRCWFGPEVAVGVLAFDRFVDDVDWFNSKWVNSKSQVLIRVLAFKVIIWFGYTTENRQINSIFN